MVPRVFSSVDEICAAVGETLGPGDWLTIDQYRIDAFADATGDHQWIHVDPERAATGPYGATIAHGYLMQSLIPLLAAGLYTIQTGSARINYGSNTIRFPTQVIAGSRRPEHSSRSALPSRSRDTTNRPAWPSA
jgi:acyl dehydratase